MKIWRFEDVKIWKCENVLVCFWAHVLMCLCAHGRIEDHLMIQGFKDLKIRRNAISGELPTAYFLLIARLSSLPTHHLPFTLNHYFLLPIACCLMPIAFYLLPIAYYLMPIAFCLLPNAFYLLPNAYCLSYLLIINIIWKTILKQTSL